MPDERPRAKLTVVNKIPAKPALPFIQELRLLDGKAVVATARWHAPLGEDGVVQILDLSVDPLHQRAGHGSAIMRAIYDQARTLFTSLEIKPRRVWISIEQKSQVIGRAFLSRHGFHHVSTIKNLLRKQDALIYLRAFD